AGPDQMTVSLHGVVLPCLLGGAEELGLEPDRRVTMLLPALVVHRAPAPLPHPHGPLASLYAAPFLEVPCHGPDRNRPAITGVHRPPSSSYGYGPGHCPRHTVTGPAIRCPSETSPARETSPSRGTSVSRWHRLRINRRRRRSQRRVDQQQVVIRVQRRRQRSRRRAILTHEHVVGADTPGVAALRVGAVERERDRVLAVDGEVTERPAPNERQQEVAAGVLRARRARLTGEPGPQFEGEVLLDVTLGDGEPGHVLRVVEVDLRVR